MPHDRGPEDPAGASSEYTEAAHLASREYDKLARPAANAARFVVCALSRVGRATEGQDHVQFLARLVDLEPPSGVRRQIMICGRPPAGARGGCRRIDHLRAIARGATHQGGEVSGHQEPPSHGLQANHCRATDSFDFKAVPKLDKMEVLELARCEWTLRRENVIMPESCLRHDALGPSGTGKSHVALGPGLAACQKGLSVGFTTAATFATGLGPCMDGSCVARGLFGFCIWSAAAMYTSSEMRRDSRAP